MCPLGKGRDERSSCGPNICGTQHDRGSIPFIIGLVFVCEDWLIAGIERGVMVLHVWFAASSLHKGHIYRALRHACGYPILSRACIAIIVISPFCRQA